MSTQTATLLFTDLVGSTELAERVGPATDDALRRELFALLRSAAVVEQGTEVKSLGDGLMFAFTSAAAALRAAAQIQRNLARRNRTAREKLTIRVGLATGETTFEDGDYFGEAVVVAARLCDAAKGGQILTTGLVVALAGSRTEIETVSVGPLELKGIADPVQAVEVHWATDDPSPLPLPAGLRVLPNATFVGRKPERQQIDAAWADARNGETTLVALGGEPGIGKTTLALQTASHAHSQGAIVTFGQASEDVSTPYGPWIPALTHLIRHLDKDVLAPYAKRFGQEISRIVPELSEQVPVPAPVGDTDPEVHRYRLFEAVATLLELASEQAPLMVVLDDLHAAQASAVQLLGHVHRSRRTAQLLICVTYLDAELGAEHPLTAVLADLRRTGSVIRLKLEGIGSGAIADLMAAFSGTGQETERVELAGAIRTETGGNPFFVTELLRNLTESGELREDGGWHFVGNLQGLPESLREVIGNRVARLGTDTQRILGTAAVFGRRFRVGTVARVVGADVDAVITACERAVASSVLTEDAEQPGWFAFRHGMIAMVLYEELGRTRQSHLHGKVAAALEDEAHPRPNFAELARHWDAALEHGDPSKFIRHATEAGRQAMAELAPSDAVRWFSAARERLVTSPDPDPRDELELLIELGDAQRQASDPAFRQTLLEAASLADSQDAGLALARAALATSRLWSGSIGALDEEMVDLYRRALDRLPADADVGLRAELHGLLADELTYSAPFEVRFEHTSRAIELARQAKDPASRAAALIHAHYALWAPEGLAQRQALIPEMMEAAEAAGPVPLFHTLVRRLQVAWEVGDPDVIRDTQDELEKVTTDLPHPLLRWVVLFMTTPAALLKGRFEAAELAATEAFEVASESGETDALTIYGGQLVAVRWEQGRWDEIVDLVSQAADENPNLPGFQAARGLALFEAGKEEEARAVLDTMRSEGLASLRHDPAWTTGVGILGELAHRLGDPEAAAEIYELLGIADGQLCTTGPTLWGSVSRVLGLLAHTTGDDEAAARHFADALAQGERLDSPILIARASYDWGRTVAAPEQALKLLTTARDVWTECGAEVMASKAAQELAVKKR